MRAELGVIRSIMGRPRTRPSKRVKVNEAISDGKLTQVFSPIPRPSRLPALVRRLGTKLSISPIHMLV